MENQDKIIFETDFDFDEFEKELMKDEFIQRAIKSWKDLKDNGNVEGMKNLLIWITESWLEGINCDEMKKYIETYKEDQDFLVNLVRPIKDPEELEEVVKDHISSTINKFIAITQA